MICRAGIVASDAAPPPGRAGANVEYHRRRKVPY
jgi:hypothetical protein